MRGTITTGDWSDDGHGQTETFQIEITGDVEALTGEGCPNVSTTRNKSWGCASTPNLWTYYTKGVEETGHDLTSFCRDYEDDHIPMELGLALLPAVFADYEGSEEDAEFDGIDDAGAYYPELWVATVNRGIDAMGITATVKIVQSEARINYNIGGYGLFWN